MESKILIMVCPDCSGIMVPENHPCKVFKATCGHEDLLGYFGNTVCGKCAKAGHKKAVGK